MFEIVDAINKRDYQGAMENLERYESSGYYDTMWARQTEASIHSRLGNYDRALEILNELGPDMYMTEALELRAEILVSMHRLDESRQDLEQAALASGDQRDAHTLYRLWTIALTEGNAEEIRKLEAEMDSRPKSDVYDMYGIYYRAVMDRDFDTARQALDRIHNLPSTTEEMIATYWDPYLILWRAQLLFEQGEVDRSLEMLEHMGDEYPRTTDQYPIIAFYSLECGRYDYALEAAMKGLIYLGEERFLDDLDPPVPDDIRDIQPLSGPQRSEDIAELLVTLSQLLIADGDVRGSMECARRAIELNPYSEGGYILASTALEISGDIDGAIETASRGLEMTPYSSAMCTKYIWFAKRYPSRIDADDPDPETVVAETIDIIGGFLDVYPRSPETAYFMGRLLQVAGEEGRLQYLETAWRESPVQWQYGLAYAAGLAETGQLEDAYEVIDDMELPTDLSWLFELSARAERIQSTELAEFVDHLRERMDPDNRFADFLD